jgi:hypothetical protein
VNPQNLQQALLVRDIVDAEWALARLSGLKPAILHAFIPRAIQSQLSEAGDAVPLDPKLVPTIRKHVTAMVAGHKGAKQELERVLQPYQLTMDTLIALAFADTIMPQLHLDRMAAAAADRRNRAYVELKHLRAGEQKPSRAQIRAEEELSDALAAADAAGAASRDVRQSARAVKGH